MDPPATNFIKTAINFTRPYLFVADRKPAQCQAPPTPLRKLLLLASGQPLKGRFQFNYANECSAAGFVPPSKA